MTKPLDKLVEAARKEERNRIVDRLIGISNRFPNEMSIAQQILYLQELLKEIINIKNEE